ncbi:MAG: 4'-phosphopantetheinyl transferase superfamily protein [Eubacteriales bacterium]
MLQIYYTKILKSEFVKGQKNQILHRVGYVLLEEVLKQAGYKYGTMIIEESGKPAFLESDLPYFNISHSGEYVMCAISDQEVGVDIQLIKEGIQAVTLAKRFYHEKELNEIMQGKESERGRLFTEIWCMKESYLKYQGTGMNRGLNTFYLDKNSSQIIDKGIRQTITYESGLIENYCYGICSDTKKSTITIKYVLLDCYSMEILP